MISQIISEIEQKLFSSAYTWSIRYNPKLGYYRKDNNIFGLASTLFVLKELKDKVSKANQDKIDDILNNSIKYFVKYRNKDSKLSYNFYPTKPSEHFKFGHLMHRFDHFRLPDDIDDTSVIFFCKNANLQQVEELRKFCLDFTYQISPNENIYNTWFGKNMPKETDLCALLNLQYLFAENNIKPNEVDIATLNYLGQNIKNIKHNPFWLSRHYGHPALIVYHYARFMSKFSALDQYKNEVIALVIDLLETTSHPYFKLILLNSLAKIDHPIFKTYLATNHVNFSEPTLLNTYSFIGAPFAPFVSAENIAAKPIFQLFWKTEIYDLALKLEFEILKNI